MNIHKRLKKIGRELANIPPDNWFRKQYKLSIKKKAPGETDPERLLLMLKGLEQALLDAVNFVSDIEYEDPRLRISNMQTKKFMKILDDYHSDVRGARMEVEMESRN